MKKTSHQAAAPSVLTAVLLALFLAAATVLSGCGGSAKSSAEITQAAQETMAGINSNSYSPEYMEEAGMDYLDSPGGMDGSGDTKFSEPGANLPGADAGMDSGGEELSGAGLTGTVLPAGRKLIRSIDLEVETDNFDSLMTHLTDRIRALGGYVEQSETTGRRATYQNVQQPRSSRIIARIPSDKTDSFVSAVETDGNVVSKSENTKDVTLEYSDIESRKKSLKIEQERIWALLEKADTLESVITLEKRLSEIRYELESMESKLRLYDNQVEYSTVTMTVWETVEYTPTEPVTTGQRIQTGFSRNLKNTAELFVNLFVGLVSGSPIWIPLLLFIGLVLFLLSRFGKKVDGRVTGLTDKTTADGETSRGGIKKRFRRRHSEEAPDEKKDSE